MSLVKPLTSYKFFKEIINFVRICWNKRKKFYPRYFFFVSKALNDVLTTLYFQIIDIKQRKDATR